MISLASSPGLFPLRCINTFVVGTGKLHIAGLPGDGIASHPGREGVRRNTLSHLMLQTEIQQDKCWPDGPRGLCADSTSTSDLLFASILDRLCKTFLTNSFATKVKVSYSSMSWRKVPLIKNPHSVHYPFVFMKGQKQSNLSNKT